MRKGFKLTAMSENYAKDGAIGFIEKIKYIMVMC